LGEVHGEAPSAQISPELLTKQNLNVRFIINN
jgi:hypothetical protein